MAGYSFIAFYGYIVAFFIGQFVIGNLTGARNLAGRQDVVLRFLGISLMSLLMIMAGITLKDQPVRPYWMIVGGVLIVTGLFISLWSQWVLGQFWVGGVGLHKQHKLITNGPYKFVRHPLYAGMVVSSIGIGVFSFNVLMFMAAFSFFGGFLLRIPAEEALMSKRFKRRHKEYVARTGLLFPRLTKRT
jgi:protein-S-isoprenylcysteine O-methyltransferase Ste14